MTYAHTPGPWKICDQDWRVVEGSDGLVVADIRSPISESGRDDARLIAAAPELLAACRELVSQFDQYLAGWTGSPLPIRIGLPAALDAARSAIAEAEGR